MMRDLSIIAEKTCGEIMYAIQACGYEISVSDAIKIVAELMLYKPEKWDIKEEEV